MSHEPRYGRTKVRQSLRQLANVRRMDCSSGKAAYETKASARSEAARISKHSGAALGTDKRLWFYRCPECDRFHLTSQRQR